jgi:hypothetical protein
MIELGTIFCIDESLLLSYPAEAGYVPQVIVN